MKLTRFSILGLVATALVLSLVQCTSRGKSRAVDAREADGLLRNRLAVVVDVREAEEVKASGKAQGAIWIPASKIEAGGEAWDAAKAGLPKDKMVVLYCQSGGRAGRVAEKLAGEGFNTGNMGGFGDWKAAGLPTEPCSECL